MEFLIKRKYGKDWREKLDVMTRFPVGDIISRECLKCNKTFEAKGKFERICGRCKGSEEWKDNEHTIF